MRLFAANQGLLAAAFVDALYGGGFHAVYALFEAGVEFAHFVEEGFVIGFGGGFLFGSSGCGVGFVLEFENARIFERLAPHGFVLCFFGGFIGRIGDHAHGRFVFGSDERDLIGKLIFRIACRDFRRGPWARGGRGLRGGIRRNQGGVCWSWSGAFGLRFGFGRRAGSWGWRGFRLRLAVFASEDALPETELGFGFFGGCGGGCFGLVGFLVLRFFVRSRCGRGGRFCGSCYFRVFGSGRGLGIDVLGADADGAECESNSEGENELHVKKGKNVFDANRIG